MSAPSPVPLAIARSMLSLGIEASRAFWTASASDGFPSGSPPPSRAATLIARASFVKCWPRRASTTAFLCLIECHLECPDITYQSRTRPTGVLGPNLPGGGTLRPQVVELDRVLIGVHAVPEAVVAVGAEVARGGQPLERLALEHAVGLEHVECGHLEAEEPPVHPVLAAGFLLEPADHAVAVELRDAELKARTDHRHRRRAVVA